MLTAALPIELLVSNARADSNRQPTVPITHNLRPAKRPTDKRRTGRLRALPLSYSGV